METVHSDIVLSAQEFGEGVRQSIGMKIGRSFFPYRIIRSSYQPPEELRITLDQEPTELRIAQEKEDEISHRPRFKLSKADIVQAVALAVCLREHIQFKKNRVTTVPETIPESIEVELEYTARGSSIEEGEHKFVEF